MDSTVSELARNNIQQLIQNEEKRKRLFKTVHILGAYVYLQHREWEEDEGSVELVKRQTRLAEVLSNLLMEGMLFPGAEEVVGLAEEMEKERVEFGRMSGEMRRAVYHFRNNMHGLKQAGEMAGVKGKRREVGKEVLERMEEEKKRVEDGLKRVEEEKRRIEERARKAEDEKKRIEEEKKRLAVENQALQGQIHQLTEEKRKAEEERKIFEDEMISILQQNGILTRLTPITSLSSLSLTFSNPAMLKAENNMIIHSEGNNSVETCLIGDVLRNVSLSFISSLSILSSSLCDVI